MRKVVQWVVQLRGTLSQTGTAPANTAAPAAEVAPAVQQQQHQAAPAESARVPASWSGTL